MLEIYSTNIDISSGEMVPFNSLALRNGGCASYVTPSSIQLNLPGVYLVMVDAYGEAAAAGEITLQLVENGVLRPGAISSVTGAVGEVDSLHFSALVEVAGGCCCNRPNPMIIQVNNVGVNVTAFNPNMTVIKIR